jgi:hypothetical protein
MGQEDPTITTDGSAIEQPHAKEEHEESQAPVMLPRRAPTAAPIFLENPDGTITEAIPSNYQERKVSEGRHSRRSHGVDGDSDGSSFVSNSDTNATVYQEADFLYSRHEKVLVLLLVCQLFLEALYDIVYVLRMIDGSSLLEFMAMYNVRFNPKSAEAFFWAIFIIQLGYSIGYYVVASLAIWTKKPKPYRLFANYSVFGIAGLVMLAYVDKFNLIIFFLHLLVYIYARFLQGLTASLLLLPPLQPA